ncbi:MAG TPA: PilZ domain-containing protein [Candidatus Sulfotelmatobacter sp.]|nr:PilZ domain-containing protein [Candidatus Sulfotelmatobacter sp.]
MDKAFAEATSSRAKSSQIDSAIIRFGDSKPVAHKPELDSDAPGVQLGPSRFNGVEFSTSSFHRKTAARAALIGFDEPARALLTECFRQFGVETVIMAEDAPDRLRHEKFEACVLALGNGADQVMEAMRASQSNSRCILYGVGGTARDALKYSKYGINAMFQTPLERPAMLKLVRATKLLVVHEFRRYVRIPIMTEVSLVGDGRRVSATSVEMSTGGMSLKTSENFFKGDNVELSFSLMTLPRVNLRGAVSWSKPKSLGVRFDPADDRRLKLKKWIDSYLEN